MTCWRKLTPSKRGQPLSKYSTVDPVNLRQMIWKDGTRRSHSYSYFFPLVDFHKVGWTPFWRDPSDILLKSICMYPIDSHWSQINPNLSAYTVIHTHIYIPFVHMISPCIPIISRYISGCLKITSPQWLKRHWSIYIYTYIHNPRIIMCTFMYFQKLNHHCGSQGLLFIPSTK